MAEHLNKAAFGEQGAGFFLGPQGYFLVEGPSGTQGHAANAAGFDGVAYNVRIDHLIIYDNKAFASAGNVGKGTAIDPAVNLAQNLDALIGRVQAMPDLPSQSRILDLLRQTRTGVTATGVMPPRNVQIAISNFGGNSAGITQKLAGRGVSFIDMNKAPAVPQPAARTYINKETVPGLARPTDGGAAAYNARRGRVDAMAEGVRFIAQTANDFSLKHAIDQELKRLSGEIGNAIASSGGAVVVVSVDAASPPGSVGMAVARSVSSAIVLSCPNGDAAGAIQRWELQPKWEKARPPHVQLEKRYLVIVPKAP
jgi:hypothetical protein